MTNKFEKDMEDLKEWQDNQYNPGLYIGTGRVSRPLWGLNKYPILLIIIGLFIYIKWFIFVILQKEFYFDIISFLLGSGFIVGGIQRIKKKK